ncbi:erythromycin esterase family protein [Streptomyces platensis]|uniref:erythromycin esterase family protein n=1 Tax=Streptomyces platensis TaxID=58346 RepID=UPI002E81C861|nr:erythromycin esterase family protein [Streptomyces platensis]WUB83366.1 erythromycin esterase family protein [Streptomyces platensis]
MLDLVQWLRTHNRDLPEDRQVRLIGMDPQRCTDSLEALATYLHQVAPEQAENVRELEPLAQGPPRRTPRPATSPPAPRRSPRRATPTCAPTTQPPPSHSMAAHPPHPTQLRRRRPPFHLPLPRSPLTPADDYDGIAFVARSNCSRRLPAGDVSAAGQDGADGERLTGRSRPA